MAFKGYGSDILLAGISYDKNAAAGQRKHQCRIEKYREQLPGVSAFRA